MKIKELAEILEIMDGETDLDEVTGMPIQDIPIGALIDLSNHLKEFATDCSKDGEMSFQRWLDKNKYKHYYRSLMILWSEFEREGDKTIAQRWSTPVGNLIEWTEQKSGIGKYKLDDIMTKLKKHVSQQLKKGE